MRFPRPESEMAKLDQRTAKRGVLLPGPQKGLGPLGGPEEQ